MDDIHSKVLSETMIRDGLSKEHRFSSILYLNNYFKTNCIIKNKQTNQYYKTGLREYPHFVCIYDSGKWFLDNSDLPEDIHYSPIEDLQTLISMDIQTNQIYNSPLKSIHNYKLSDIQLLATEMNIELMNQDNKKKRKKELYDELNLKYIQQSI